MRPEECKLCLPGKMSFHLVHHLANLVAMVACVDEIEQFHFLLFFK